MTEKRGLAYLDHSSLNDMYNGSEQDILEFLESNGLQAVYSDENLTEIRNSIVRRDYFIEQLDNLNAVHIENPLDLNWNQTNSLRFSAVPASERLATVERNEADQRGAMQANIDEDAEDMITAILTKLHGADSEKSVKELMGALLDQAASGSGGVLDDTIEELRTSLGIFGRVDDELEANGSPFSAENVEKHLGYSIAEISGVSKPDIIVQLWQMVGQKFDDFASVGDYQDHLMSVSSFQYGVDGSSQLTLLQRANDLYHWLNLIWYHKDENIKTTRKMKGSFRDMTHAAYAMAGSTHFLCSDERLRLKAEAIYEHLDFGVVVIDTKSPLVATV